MIGLPVAHVGGIPIEETLASLGPALFVGFGVAWANLRARVRPVGSRVSPDDRPRKERARSAGGLALPSRRIASETNPRTTEREPMSLIDCPQCGLPAQIVECFALNGTSGPVEHVKMRCVAGHALTPLVEHLQQDGSPLLDGAAPTLERVAEATEGGRSTFR